MSTEPDSPQGIGCGSCRHWCVRPDNGNLGWCAERQENTWKHQTFDCIFFEERKVEASDGNLS